MHLPPFRPRGDALPYAASVSERLVFDGRILGATFASGDRIVAGRWHASPFGPFADVMWCPPGAERILLAPTETIAGFIARHYPFDEVRVAPVGVERAAAPSRWWRAPYASRSAPGRPASPAGCWGSARVGSGRARLDRDRGCRAAAARRPL